MNKEELRILYLGTPELSSVVLKGLIDNLFNIVGVIAQEDKKVGRKMVLTAPPVKVLASSNNIPVYQFDKLKEHEEILDVLKPNLIISCAYGQLISEAFINYPKYGCINVHGSYLPFLRGGAPIHHSLIDGYSYTGVTIMSMVKKMDAGLIYSQEKIDILDSDNLDSLKEKIGNVGRDLLLKTLPDYIDGKLKGIIQDESKVTFGYNIKPEEEVINFDRPVREVFNHIRGLSSEIGAYCYLNDKKLKIYKSSIFESISSKEVGVVEKTKKSLRVYCKRGSLLIEDVQLEGKKRMDIGSFLNGYNENIERLK